MLRLIPYVMLWLGGVNCLNIINSKEAAESLEPFLLNFYDSAVETSIFTKQAQYDISTVEDNPINTEEVQTSSGKLVGIVREEASCFYGIPFAEPPVEQLRYKLPVPLNTPDDNLDASINNRRWCPQPSSPLSQISEDCLYLNVYVPRDVDFTDPGKIDAKPVMVFFHGGAFFSGSATLSVYDSRWMANLTDTVIVTVNYRLGPLGFLHFDDGENKISGNLGIDDQRVGLQWVNDNIQNFGGDATKITIFGESAGAQSVMLHLLSDKSSDLFQSAIMESNPAAYPYFTPEEAFRISDMVVNYLNCTHGNEYECLMTAPATFLVATLPLVMARSVNDIFTLIEPFRPVIDEVEFSKQPLECFQDGDWQSDKTFIIGTNTEEADFIYKLNPLPIPIMTEQIYRQLARQLMGCTLYMYYNDHPRKDGACGGGYVWQAMCDTSFHASELVYVFQNGQHIGYNFSSADFEVQEHFLNYWKNFAHYYDPSPAGEDGASADWPPHATENLQSIFIQSSATEVKDDHMQEDCNFWESLDYYIDLSGSSTTSSTPVIVVTDGSTTDVLQTTSGVTRTSCSIITVVTLLQLFISSLF